MKFKTVRLNLVIAVNLGAMAIICGCSHSRPLPPEPTGAVDRGKIRAVVKAHLSEVTDCFNEALKKDPKLKGKLVIRWTIGPGPSGKVSEAGVKSSDMDAPDFEACAVDKLKTWTFPSPPLNEEAVVSYPFVFQAP